jgi:hypothetical protein
MTVFRPIFQTILRRPLSALASLLFVLLILYEIGQILQGQLYMETLGYIDGTTVIELGLLGLWGIYSLRARTDLQAVAFTLVNALSFIFSYEALYKWSFYLAPFHLHMPPAEFRQMVIQIGIALSVTTGFAVGFFALRKGTFLWLGLFGLLWIIWLLGGYPQITGEVYWPRVIPVTFAHNMVYAINRATKLALWLAYLTLFPGRLISREHGPLHHED